MFLSVMEEKRVYETEVEKSSKLWNAYQKVNLT